jgi:hypothetical protein
MTTNNWNRNTSETPPIGEDRLEATYRCGFTLLEVILAVSLSVMVVAAIATAIHLNVTVLQRQQVRIERTQVARSVLMMIASDLRAAFQYKPADVTGLAELQVSQAAIAGIAAGADLSETDTSQIDTSGLDPSLLAGATASAGNGTGGDAGAGIPDGSGSSGSQNISSAPTEILRPGLYGNSTEIMVDISRLPRIDQYSPVVVGTSGPISLPTDIKTIAYFVADESMETDSMIVGMPTTAGGGLYRRELDRAVAAFNLDVAGMLAAEGYTRLIATEVIAVEFRYFDGSDFRSDWDSDEMGGFPSAVEVTILVDPQRGMRESGAVSFQLEQAKAYRSVVYLPVAEILPEEETAAAGSATGGSR